VFFGFVQLFEWRGLRLIGGGEFEIHGDQDEIVITSGNIEYRFKPKFRSVQIDIRTEHEPWNSRDYFCPYPPETVFEMRTVVGESTLTKYFDAPLTYGEGVWLH
jgi:hypothetical protein